MTSPHAPRPGDLVALVSFDGEVYANQAVTRDRLGSPATAPHALGAAIRQWLGRRPVWIDVRGRQIQGIATARELAGESAWEIDTLVDAGEGDCGVIAGLLRQATEAAAEAGAGRLLLRTRSDAPAVAEALQAGFTRALDEQLWVRTSPPPAGDMGAPAASVTVREGSPQADAFFGFQIYSRAIPFNARQVLGMTFDEWAGAQDRRWSGRNARQFLAADGGQMRALLHVNGEQLMLLAEPGQDACADAALTAAERTLGGRVLALQPDCTGTPASVLRAHGFEPVESYTLLALRTMRPIRETAPERIRARTVVPSGG